MSVGNFCEMHPVDAKTNNANVNLMVQSLGFNLTFRASFCRDVVQAPTTGGATLLYG